VSAILLLRRDYEASSALAPQVFRFRWLAPDLGPRVMASPYAPIAAPSIATAAALPLAAVANACSGGGDFPADYEFITPSGNIICNMYADNAGANCEVREHIWVAPASTRGPYGRARDFSFGGLEFYASQAKPANLGCYEGISRFKGPEDTRLRPDLLARRDHLRQ
jgi:hypothetical protein